MAQYDMSNSCYYIGLFLTKTGIRDVFMSTCAYIRHIYKHTHMHCVHCTHTHTHSRIWIIHYTGP